MKRWLAKLTIGTYLTALSLGIVCHAMNFGLSSHPGTYYFVWDMFCGWSAHEVRYHLIGEGESGHHYRLSPAPWNTFAPYGDLERDQYDALGNTHAKIALNTLKHTDHEPIVRFFLVEEAWPKKYNLADHLWAARFDEPKDPHSYCWLKCTYDADGTVLKSNMDFIGNLQTQAVADNPRLKADSQRGKPFFAVDPTHRINSNAVNAGTYIGTEDQLTRPSAN
ncbi:MAG: hypothetical protein JSS49_22790 [Planctomycetes bacterium]|nr:hypothetical protein [Planctomycetota bacterium]